MFCKYCGAKIDDDELFCSKCGERTHVSNNNSDDSIIDEMIEEQIDNESIDWSVDSNEEAKQYIEKENSEGESSNKTLKTIIISFFVIIALIATIIPIVNNHKNKVIDTELGSLVDTNNYLVENANLNDSGMITISFSNSLDWNKLENKNIQTTVHIMESGAICDMDKKGAYSLAKGYSGTFSGDGYSFASKQERAKEFGDDDEEFYNLCVGTAVSDVLNKSTTYEFSYCDDSFVFDENRIYNFSIELYNKNGSSIFDYDSYFRYTNGSFKQVKTSDLKPEDTYFAWKDNKLHFATFSSYSNDTPPQPCFHISDETYDSRN